MSLTRKGESSCKCNDPLIMGSLVIGEYFSYNDYVLVIKVLIYVSSEYNNP